MQNQIDRLRIYFKATFMKSEHVTKCKPIKNIID